MSSRLSPVDTSYKYLTLNMSKTRPIFFPPVPAIPFLIITAQRQAAEDQHLAIIPESSLRTHIQSITKPYFFHLLNLSEACLFLSTFTVTTLGLGAIIFHLSVPNILLTDLPATNLDSPTQYPE